MAFSAIGVELPAVLGGLVGSIALVALLGSVISVPVGLAALGSYRRRTPPSRSRTAWTAVVLALMSPLAWAAGVLLCEVVFAM
ncbi:hypothetical protein BSZ36_14540 [Rubricoccus marinus]|uniref:Uncharacterized protein n=1 Tax=Rubricoccus marinus TaxID=716817 RepID=A0A259U214_9BACT|nr:hypothetical protein BSZ36_14540 [Rubricoccus marinus]